MTENFKTMKQAELEINPLKEESIIKKMQVSQLLSNFTTSIHQLKKYKCQDGELIDDFLSQKLQLVLEQFSEAKDFKLPVSGLITPLKKSSLVSQVRELVKSNTNDMLLGEAVRKLFS